MSGNGNPLRELWRAGQGALGTWCVIPSSYSAEVIGRLGFDWVCVDFQHSLVGLETVASMVQAISTTGAVPIVRVPNEPWLIQRALDAGAYGVVIPLVNDRDDAVKASAACRYPPEGSRSYGPMRIASSLGPDPRRANAEVLCLVMIETMIGLENAEEICSTPGVDGVLIGPADLSLSLGGASQLGEIEPEILKRLLDICHREGVPAGLVCRSGAAARSALEAGFLWVSLSSDRDLLTQAARDELALARIGTEQSPLAASDRVCRVVVGPASVKGALQE